MAILKCLTVVHRHLKDTILENFRCCTLWKKMVKKVFYFNERWSEDNSLSTLVNSSCFRTTRIFANLSLEMSHTHPVCQNTFHTQQRDPYRGRRNSEATSPGYIPSLDWRLKYFYQRNLVCRSKTHRGLNLHTRRTPSS